MVQLLLYLHIVSGAASLLFGLINLLMKKGGLTHRRMGRVFVFSMFVAGLSAIGLATIKSNFFLLFVGIFSLYLTLAGFMYIRHPYNPRLIRSVAIVMLIAGVALMSFGLMKLQEDNFGIVPMVFGGIGALLASMDLKAGPADYKSRSVRHLQRIIGAYISTCTAFLVVNIQLPAGVPSFIPWLLPTALLTPYIAYWSKKQKTST